VPDLVVSGADRLITLSKQLRAVGDKDLKREARVALRDATKPMKAAIHRYDLANLPKRGGLNRVMARSRITTQVRGSGNNPGVRIATRSHDPRIDRSGRVWHPTFGHRDRGVVQQIDSGYFTVPAGRAATEGRVQLLAAMKRIERKLEAR
jgi:hypothetical protein